MKYIYIVLLLGCFCTPPSYAACFQGDCQNGRGAYRSVDGVIYVGQWLEGKYHGRGAIFYPDGSSYTGNWQAGEYQGHGALTLPDGKKKTGIFDRGELIQEQLSPPPARPQIPPGHKISRPQLLPPERAKKKKHVPRPDSHIPGEYPESSTSLLTEAALEDRTAAELQMMVNEIYARHSHIFHRAEIKKHFSRQAWYTPQHRVEWSMLSAIERTNIKLIKKYQARQD